MASCNETCVHPDGLLLTRHMMSLCAPISGLWLDIGCGHGETVRLVQNEYGVDVTGIDSDADILNRANELGGKYLCADAHALPFQGDSVDGIIMECCLSLMHDPKAVINSCGRLLKSGGTLAISDVYAKKESADTGGALGRLYTKGEIIEMMRGFFMLHFEDRSEDLRVHWGQMIMEGGTEALYQTLGDRQEIKRAGVGYYLLIARRSKR